MDKRSESLDAARVDVHKESATFAGGLVTQSHQTFVDAHGAREDTSVYLAQIAREISIDAAIVHEAMDGVTGSARHEGF